MKQMTNMQQRALALSLLILAALAVMGLLVLPIVNGFAERNLERDALMADYLYNARMLASMPTLRAERLAQKRTMSSFAITAISKEAGREIFSRRIAATVENVGGAVTASGETHRKLPPNWIGIRNDLQLSTGQLTQVLKRLQNEEPYVVVDYLSIGAISPDRPGGFEYLDVRIEISAPFRIFVPPSRPGTDPRPT